jgi:hypothetical protein
LRNCDPLARQSFKPKKSRRIPAVFSTNILEQAPPKIASSEID